MRQPAGDRVSVWCVVVLVFCQAACGSETASGSLLNLGQLRGAISHFSLPRGGGSDFPRLVSGGSVAGSMTSGLCWRMPARVLDCVRILITQGEGNLS